MALSIGAPPHVDILSPIVTVPATAGGTLSIAWQITTPSGNELTGSPVDLYVTTDDGLTTTLAQGGLANNAASCNAPATGCATINVPSAVAGRPFRVVVTATDVAGGIGAASSIPYNSSANLTLLGGRNAKAVGQSALTTAVMTTGALAREPQTGDIFLATATGNVIYRVDARTGVMRHWAGAPNITSPSTGDRSALRFRLLGRRNSTSGSIVLDSASNVYLATTNGIIKCVGDACTRVVGSTATTGASLDSGTPAMSINWAVAKYAAIAFGQNDRMYFSLVPSNCYALPVWRPCNLVYRVEDNGSATLLAGTADINAPQAGSPSHPATDVRISDFTVVPRAGDDRVVVGGYPINEGAAPYYELQGATMYRISVNGAQLYAYDAARRLIPYSNGNQVRFFDIDAPATAYPAMPLSEPGANSALYYAVADEYGGLYATAERLNRVFYWPVGAATYDGFAGAPVESSDGALFANADLRGIRQLVFTNDGTIYAHSSLAQRVRRIATDGTLTTVPVGNASISTGGAPLMFTSFMSPGPFRNEAGTCVYYCGGTVTAESNLFPYATSGSPSTLGLAMTGRSLNRVIGARSGSGFLTWTASQNSATNAANSLAWLITGSASFSVVAGSLSLQDIPWNDPLQYVKFNTSIAATGNTLTTSHMGYIDPYGGAGLYVYDQTLYMQSNEGRLYVGRIGGSWAPRAYNMQTMTVRESDGTAFWIDLTNGNLRSQSFDANANPTASATPLTNLRNLIGSDLRGLAFDSAGALHVATDTQIFRILGP